MCLGIPAKIVEIVDPQRKLAKVDVNGVRRQISVDFLVDEENPLDNCVGEWVLVHVGFAMSRISAEEAAKTLQLLEQLGEAQREMEAMTSSIEP